MRDFERYKFIFLCGLHRSGTSPLFRILRDHPEISGFRDTGVPEDEGQHLQTVVPAAKAYGGPGCFGFAPAAHLTEKSGLMTVENRNRLFGEWSRYWNLTKLYLLEKSPPNLIRTRFLQALFPNSYFIVIFRHPIAVSLATSKWTNSNLESLLQHWLHCHELFEVDRRQLERILVIKYEDLIRATGPTLEQVYEFLGLAPHVAPSLDAFGNQRYFTTWRNLSAEKEGTATFRRIVAKYESKVRRYGYSLVDCEDSAPLPTELGISGA
jgi:hypothetical protein